MSYHPSIKDYAISYQDPDVQKGLDAFDTKLKNGLSNLGDKVPSLNRTIEEYFEANMSGIIDEWDLIVDNDLKNFEMRVMNVEKELTNFDDFKQHTEKRVKMMERELAKLEE